jgi:hypothetical protein
MIIATASYDDTVRLWTVEDRTERRVLYGHTDSVRAVAFSLDGELLASGSSDITVRLWHVNSGARCGIMKGHTGAVAHVAYSRDGTLVGSKSEDRTFRLWSPRTSEQLYVIHDRDMRLINWLKFSADARIISTNKSAHQLSPLSSSATAEDESLDLSYALAIQNRWLTCNFEHLLWLPPQNRTEMVATHDLTIALGLEWGEFIVMAFDFLSGRPWEDMTVRRGAGS